VSSSIEVRCVPTDAGWSCRVTVSDGRGAATVHVVAVREVDLARLAPGESIPDDLVRRSFEFLLAREPKESILERFELAVIGRYFPEYEQTIRR
jgi:hypothetical protein